MENKNLLFILLSLTTKNSPLLDTTELAWALAACKKIAQISLCVVYKYKWKNEIPPATVALPYFSRAIPSQASVSLDHVYFDVTVMTEMTKSFVPTAAYLHTDAFTSCGSFRARQLNEAGGRILMMLNSRAVLRDGMHLQSPGPWKCHTTSLLMTCETSAAFSRVLSQHLVLNLSKLVVDLFACLPPPQPVSSLNSRPRATTNWLLTFSSSSTTPVVQKMSNE